MIFQRSFSNLHFKLNMYSLILFIVAELGMILNNWGETQVLTLKCGNIGLILIIFTANT